MGSKKINKDIFLDARLNITGKKMKKGFSLITGLRITPTNNEVKDIIKEMKSLENREILLKRTTRNITGKEGGFLNFLRALMTAGLPLASRMTTLIISNEEINDIIKTVKSIEESGLLIKGVSEIFKNEAREQKGGFFGMLFGTLCASLLGNLLTGKDTITAGEGTISAGEETIRASQDF